MTQTVTRRFIASVVDASRQTSTPLPWAQKRAPSPLLKLKRARDLKRA